MSATPWICGMLGLVQMASLSVHSWLTVYVRVQVQLTVFVGIYGNSLFT